MIRNTEDIKRRLKAIAAKTYDPEAAHKAERQLFIDVLQAIEAENTEDAPWRMAHEALKVMYLEFPRWTS